MKILRPKDKSKYFKKNYPFYPVPKLTDEKKCLHCGEIFKVGDYKVQLSVHNREQSEIIVCPNAPICSGDAMDWVRTDF